MHYLPQVFVFNAAPMGAWDFQQIPDHGWQWRHVSDHTGAAATGAGFVSRNDCIADAMRHGYLSDGAGGGPASDSPAGAPVTPVFLRRFLRT